jgi:hypothetical protein
LTRSVDQHGASRVNQDLGARAQPGRAHLALSEERYLSHRLHDDYEAIVDAACAAWNKLTAEAGRITSLCS